MFYESGENRENDTLIFLVFTDLESGRIGFPGVSLRSTLGYYARFASSASHALRLYLLQGCYLPIGDVIHTILQLNRFRAFILQAQKKPNSL